MKTISNRIAILALAVLFLCGNLLSYPFYRFALSEAKAEMQREMFGPSAEERAHAQQISLSENEFEKVSQGENEICLDGNWYDIISVSHSGGKVILSCLGDKHESLLHAWLNRSVHDNDASSAPSKSGKQMKLAFSGDYLPSPGQQLGFNGLEISTVSAPSSPAVVCGGHYSLPEMPPRA